jgi:hypothetical protein
MSTQLDILVDKAVTSKPPVNPDEDESYRALVREKVGLTYEVLCKAVSEGLTATVALISKDTGEQCGEVPAHSTRAKFAPLAAEILGAKKAEVGAQKCPQINIHLPPGFSFK